VTPAWWTLLSTDTPPSPLVHFHLVLSIATWQSALARAFSIGIYTRKENMDANGGEITPLFFAEFVVLFCVRRMHPHQLHCELLGWVNSPDPALNLPRRQVT
jgi:hypothetical protein